MPRPVRVTVFFIITLAVIAGFFASSEPIPQPPAYHNFADQRPLLGLPHLLNVVSNLPFLVVGVCGLWFMASSKSRRPGVFLAAVERWPYWVYFLGLALTALGSAYYHADPTNARLTWDRLPLTITFMGLFTAVLAERLDPRLAGWLLGPLVALGMVSVIFWHVSETSGAGDMRFYLVVQFFPMIALPLLLLLFAPRYTGTPDLIAALVCYGLAKVLELLDRQIYTQGGFVSGHTLKHLVAGLSAYFILHTLQRRRPCAGRGSLSAPR